MQKNYIFQVKRLFALALFFSLGFWQSNLNAQNNCATAVALVIDANCGGTASGPGANSGDPTGNDEVDGNVCSANYSGGDDYIFTYTATTTDALALTLTTTNSWSGLLMTEGCPTTGTCFAASTSSGTTETFTSPAMTVGVTYYIQISTWPSPQSAGQFCLDASLESPAMVPVNNDCTAPTGLTVNADEACGVVTSGTIEAATASGEDETSCSGTEDDDVWYTFVATNTIHTITLQNVAGSTTDLYHSLWSGSCGALTNVLCSDPNTSTATGLTIGTTYLLRVYTWTATIGQNTTFDVCIGTPSPPPANDDCAGAIDYDTAFGAIGAAGTCPGNTISLNIAPFTDAGEDPTCDFGGDAAAWYTWTANHTSVTFSSGTGAPGLEILSGSCGAFTSLGCLNNVGGVISGLTVGSSYYLIIWDDGTSGTTVDWCLEGSAPPPANDDCPNAISITNGGTIAGDNTTATDVEGLAACSGGGGGGNCAAGGAGTIDWGPGLWYVYNSTSAESITVEVTGFDSEVQVFEGPCGSLTCIGGDDDSSPSGAGSLFCWLSTASATGAAPSRAAPVDYYIYVDGHGSNAAPFSVSVNALPLPVELVSFEGETMKSGNKLSWATATEVGTEAFVVEKSHNGFDTWREIGRVNASGNSTVQVDYEFMDENPLAKSYYRLKSVDFDRSEQLSEVISLTRDSEGFTVTSAFPNPTKDVVNVQFHSPTNTTVEVMITDITGRLVQTNSIEAQDGINNFDVKMSALAAGTYFLTLSNEIERVVERIVKQ